MSEPNFIKFDIYVVSLEKIVYNWASFNSVSHFMSKQCVVLSKKCVEKYCTDGLSDFQDIIMPFARKVKKSNCVFCPGILVLFSHQDFYFLVRIIYDL